MANTRELRRRIKSVKNTSQITKAMQMVAATKMRRAQSQALAGRPYIDTLNEVLLRLSGRIDPEVHLLLQEGGGEKLGMLILSTDKSLCGALNTNLFRAIHNFLAGNHHPELDSGSNQMDSRLRGNDSKRSGNDKEGRGSDKVTNAQFYSVGKKGRGFVVKTNKELVADFENTEAVTFRQSAQIAKILVEAFLKKEIKEAFIAFPKFVSSLRQEPTIEKLLPIDKSTIYGRSSVIASPQSGEAISKQDRHVANAPRDDVSGSNEFIFEPNPDLLLDYILVHSVETRIYQALLETKASEHSSRMIAMQNATDNANELVEDLNLTYNQTRQAAITNELLDIVTAGAALG